MASPNIILYAPGGFMLGAMIGLGLAFLMELSNDTIRTPQEVMRSLRIPLLGMICHSDNDEDLLDIDSYQVIRQAPFSITSECYRQLKTNFKLSSTGTHKTITFVSGAPGEGKTTVAVNLASALVAEGKKVLFIDANFRRPTSAKLFPQAAQNGSASEHSDYGLSNLLMGQCEADQAVRHCTIENFDVVDSGPLPANPAELLGSQAMRIFLDRVNEIYDYVILDGPPLLISDATTIAAISDAVVVVFNATSTKKGAGQRTLRELAQINAPVIGSVLVAVRTLKGGYMHENIETYQNYQRAELKQQIN
jgi:capsular exopolysaccharide synthesis family protein